MILIDQARWHTLFDPLSTVRPDLVTTEIHASLDHSLPSDPASAYTAVTAAAHNLEARSAGTALVGDNLGASLGAARSDAAYAQVLFLFLGLPAAVLAGLLTAAVVTAGQVRRRQEQALLRARGTSRSQLVGLAAVEAVVVGVCGSVVGLTVAALVGWATFGSARFGATNAGAVGWAAAAAATGLAVAAASVLAPAWLDLRRMSVAAGRAAVTATATPRWARFGLDIALLVASGVLFWLTSRNGYQLVLAPEGVPTISVSYWAFAAPALLWVGAALLIWRVSDLLLGRGRRIARDRPAPVCRIPVADRGQFDFPPAASARTGDRPACPGTGVRVLHRDVQRHLPRPGRGRTRSSPTAPTSPSPNHPATPCRRPRPTHCPACPVCGRSNRSSTASPTSAPTFRTSTASPGHASPRSPRCRTLLPRRHRRPN